MLAFGLSGHEWLIILIIVLLLFGTRIPTLARSLGQGITEFKKGLKGDGPGTGGGPASSGPTSGGSGDAHH